MAANHFRASRARAFVLAGLFWPALRPAWVCAGYTNKLTTTPDFVQDNFGPAGDQLPYDGLEFCCPTAVAMSLGYLGVNGFNQIAPSTPTLAQGLNLDEVLSGFMATTAVGGTASNADIVSGIDTYLDAKGISSSNYTVSSYASPSLTELASLNQNQTVVDLVCGYYNTSDQRLGGHCVALDSQGVNLLGQSSPNMLAINNPEPSAFEPFPDIPANSVQYDNITTTSGGLTSDGALELNPAQYENYNSPIVTVIETALALTVNAAEQSANNPAASAWTLSSTQSFNLNNGTLSVIAPLNGAGGINMGTGGLLQLQAPDTTTGTNTLVAGVLESTITSGQPFGTGSFILDAGSLELAPSPGTAALSLAVAGAAGRTISFAQGASIILNADGNNSLTLTIGGYANGTIPNLARSGKGTLIVVCGDGSANLGTTDRVLVTGTAKNLPALTDGVVAPYMVAQNNDANASGDFLTYNTNGLAVAAYTTSATSQLDAAGGNAIYQADANQALTLSETAQVEALKVDNATISGALDSTLNIGGQNTGQFAGVIFNGGSISVPNLSLGAAEGLIYTSNANGVISSAIQGSGGLTTFGPGTLTLSGSNNYTGGTNIESGTLNAASTAGSATSNGSITVYQNGTLQISGAKAVAGGSGGTTINSGGTLWLNGGTLAGTLTLNGNLQGHGVISGAATLSGTINSTAATGPANITFTNAVNLSGNSTIYTWELNALDDKPADAGSNWSTLNFTDGTVVNLGTSTTNAIHFALDLGAGVPDPNSGNPFWNSPHTWTVATATPYFNYIYYYYDFPSYSQGDFTAALNNAFTNLSVSYTPYTSPQGIQSSTWIAGSGSWTSGAN